MIGNNPTVEQWKKAYRVLDVPTTASALAIKSNYRKLIKRWHPDLPATSAATAAEATQMTKLINEAYGQIQNAPLRYYSGAEEAETAAKRKAAPKSRNVNQVDLSRMFFNENRIEYAVRIVCGAIAGVFVGLSFSVDVFRDGIAIVAVIVLCAIGFATGAVKYGDRFWQAVLGNWWKWQ